nr:aromatic-ring-hydroxylating dioxygenase subunit beta [uncultured Lichenicoccus sp.]
MSETMAKDTLRLAAYDLLETYGRLLDEDKLEEWVDLFVEDSLYEIVSRENRVQNLPLSLMLCDSKDMLRDRIMSLREANIYNLHADCHVIGLIRVEAGETVTATAPYALFQSTPEGDSRLFSVGRYYLELTHEDGTLRIKRQSVVVDTGAIPTLLATPI